MMQKAFNLPVVGAQARARLRVVDGGMRPIAGVAQGAAETEGSSG
jgi:hypothetical protein